MTQYHARARRSRNGYFDALLVDQSTQVEDLTLDTLRDFDAALLTSGIEHRLVVLDNPAPARGYAVLFRVGETSKVIARAHMLAQHPEEAYRALFSQAYVQAKQMIPEGESLELLLDEGVATSEMADAVNSFGAEYGFSVETEADNETADGATDEHPEGSAEPGEDAQSEELPPPPAEEQGEPSTPDPETVEEVEVEETETVEVETADADADADDELPPLEEVTEEEPFVCEECGKGFTSAQGLGAHSRSHKG